MNENTVRVRVALVLDECGNWNAIGYSSAKDDNEVMGICLDGFEDGKGNEQTYWLTATFILPATAEVEAFVEPAVSSSVEQEG